MNKFKEIIDNFLGSLDTNNHGWSARKLTAITAILTGIYITVYKLPLEAQLHALYAWQTLSLLCLGIITLEQVIKLKNGNSNTNEEKK